MSHRSHRKLLVTAALLVATCQRSAPSAEVPERADAGAAEAATKPATGSGAVSPAIAKILPEGAGAPSLEAIGNLKRLPTLDDRHRDLLARHGFFVAPQSIPGPGATKAEAREGRRAKHLFQVYERNDYIRFPSYVTADLAIDLTHQYFDVVLRRTEREHLAPRMRTALQGFVVAAEDMRASAKSAEAREAARQAAIYWGTLLHLLEQPARGDAPDAPIVRSPWEEEDPELAAEAAAAREAAPAPEVTRLPKSIAAEVDRRVKLVQAAADKHRFDDWGVELDLTQTKPRGHYADAGVLQRYFRAMSLVGLSSFVVEGDDARPDFVSALTLSYAADPKARAAYDQVLSVTSFVVGAPPTRGLAAAAKARAAHATTIDAAVAPAGREAIVAAWKAFPAHPIEANGPVIQPFGQRVFGDTLAMSPMLKVVRDLQLRHEPVVARAMGAAGAAAVLGHAGAHAIVESSDPEIGPQLAAALDTGHAGLGDTLARPDAYHRTLAGLDALWQTDPLYFDREAWDLRLLQSFAGGWAMLRHDTLLYAYQMGAECDAEDLPAPYGWVEPASGTYAALRTMIAAFASELEAAGIRDTEPEEGHEWDTPFHTTKAKTKALDEFLAELQRWVDKQARGERLTADERTELATIGGRAEHVLLTLADAWELGDGNDDMAVIADVFTFRGRALEVGVGHPELIYAVIPTPDGWQVARGAVLAYRELWVDAPDRMTDQAWRERLATSKDFEAGAKPDWLAPIAAPAVGVVELAPKEQAQERCGYYGGAYTL